MFSEIAGSGGAPLTGGFPVVTLLRIVNPAPADCPSRATVRYKREGVVRGADSGQARESCTGCGEDLSRSRDTDG